MLNFHDPGCLTARQYYEDYSMPLARAFFAINQRGIAVHPQRLEDLRIFILDELQSSCSRVSTHTKIPSVIPFNPLSEMGKKLKQPVDTLNLSSPDQIIEVLKGLGLKPPKVRRQSGDYTESTNAEALNEMFAETGHPVLKEILRVRELNKILGTNVNATLFNNILYGAYFVTGTITDRRSCRENYLGLGTNMQNQPKHSDLGKRFRECLIARPGKILIQADQASAEDWIIQGIIADLTRNRSGLEDLVRGGRHEKLACFIFSIPRDRVRYDVERYIAKKVRYAGSYDMEAFRFSKVMAEEGYVVPIAHTEWLLSQFHTAEPTIRNVYHNYVQTELINNRTLVTPFGYTRQFMALRDRADNKKVFKEGYAQIPQSTVGTNTGMAILWFETYHPGLVIEDGHDAVYLEVDDNIDSIVDSVNYLQTAFDRIVRFPNGLEIQIPIEIEMGYDLEHVKKCGDLSRTGLVTTYESLNRVPSHLVTSTTGAPQASSAQL